MKIRVRNGYLAAHASLFWLVVAYMFMGLIVPAVIWVAVSFLVVLFGREADDVSP